MTKLDLRKKHPFGGNSSDEQLRADKKGKPEDWYHVAVYPFNEWAKDVEKRLRALEKQVKQK